MATFLGHKFFSAGLAGIAAAPLAAEPPVEELLRQRFPAAEFSALSAIPGHEIFSINANWVEMNDNGINFTVTELGMGRIKGAWMAARFRSGFFRPDYLLFDFNKSQKDEYCISVEEAHFSKISVLKLTQDYADSEGKIIWSKAENFVDSGEKTIGYIEASFTSPDPARALADGVGCLLMPSPALQDAMKIVQEDKGKWIILRDAAPQTVRYESAAYAPPAPPP